MTKSIKYLLSATLLMFPFLCPAALKMVKLKPENQQEVREIVSGKLYMKGIYSAVDIPEKYLKKITGILNKARYDTRRNDSGIMYKMTEQDFIIIMTDNTAEDISVLI